MDRRLESSSPRFRRRRTLTPPYAFPVRLRLLGPPSPLRSLEHPFQRPLVSGIVRLFVAHVL
uniref:Uncharacterized protein n=1 Tax=Arundo donax TaxID=35708 RepID=A0A0A8YH98_ARUDO